MKHLLTLIAALLAPLVLYAQPVAAVAPKDDSPVITLPPIPPPANVQKFDPLAIRAKAHPYHVTLTKSPEAWAINPAAKGKGVKVAILDTWAQPDHPLYAHQVKGQYDAITKKLNPPKPAKPHDHGTHVAGIVARILPECELYLITVLDSSGSGSVAGIAHGIDYATTEFKVDVSNLSLGGPTADNFLPPAIKRAVAAGNIVICAAGNDGGGPGRDTEGYPGGYKDAVSVAACDSQRRLAPFSSWGPNVFTTDPGVDIDSSLPDNRMGEMSGTSMATPVASGKAGSWVASNAVPRDAERVARYRAAVIKASPFQDRNNARGYGLYTLDKITGEADTTPPPKPGEKVYTLSLAELQRQGYTSVRIDLGAGATSTPPIPVASLPTTGGVVYGQPQPVPVPAYHGFNPIPQYSPPPAIYSPMPSNCGPGGCPGGVCQPQPAPLFPVLRRVFR